MQETGLFEGIRQEEREALLHCLSSKEQGFSKNEFVLRAGVSAPVTGLVRAGALQIIKEDYWGNRAIIEIAGPGDLFGEAFSCAEIPTVPVSVVAARQSRVLFFDYSKLLTVCPASCPFHLRVIKNMTKILARKNMLLMQKMEHITKRTTREKLLSYLSTQAFLKKSSSFDIPFNRQELADYLSVDRSAMSAELSRMREEGLIRFQKNHFTLIQ